MATRRVATVTGDGELTVETEPRPDPGAGEVAIDVRASAISPGTEGSIVTGRRVEDGEADPRPIGYQNAGEVAAVGEGVDRFAPGDRVTGMGSGYALHADHAVVPANLCAPLPDGVSYEAGAFNHLAATALNGIRRADLRIGEYVAVVGLGPVGQFTGQLAAIAGCHVMGIDQFENRVAAARECGFERAVAGAAADAVDDAAAFTGGRGTDAGFVCFGGDATAAFEALIEVARERPDGHHAGRITIIGGATVEHRFPTALGNMDVRAASRTGPGYHDPEWERGGEYDPMVRWTTRRNLDEVLFRMASGDLAVEPLITHRYPLDEVAAAYGAAIERPDESLGIVLTP